QIAMVLSPANRDRKLVPILYAECQLPPRLSRLTWIDFRDTHGDEGRYDYRFAQLLADLRPDLYERPKDFERFQQQRRQQETPDPKHIPPVSPLPKGSRMPRASIGNFVGREKELCELARRLTPGSGSLVGVHAAVTGLGGVGKSQLAIEYAHRYGRRYPGGVFWLNMEKAEDAITEVASCGGPQGMDIEGFSDRPVPEQAAFVVHKLWEEGPAARLLIFDNAEDPELVEQWRPKYGPCAVLITSRRDYWPRTMNVQSLPIKTLPRPNSLELLAESRPGLLRDAEERQATDELCAHLGDLPLALQVAAAYLERYPSEHVKDYLQELRQAAGTDLEKVWSCFAVSYRKLKPEEETDALALRLFQLAGYFAPTSIARPLLAEAAELDLAEKEGRRQLNGTVARLQELALMAQEADGRMLLHRLLWEFARRQDLPQTQENAALRVANVLLSFAQKENATGLPQALSKERVHLRQAALEAEHQQSELAGDLYNELGYHARVLALLEEAKSDFERALQIGERVYGSDHPNVAAVANNIGQILKEQGDLAGALEYSQRALQIDEQVYGPDHPSVARDANNIGTILKEQGDLAGALEYIRRALKIGEKVYGPDHPSVAIRANNIGLILQEQGDLAGALDYIRRALKIGEKVYGPDHPSVAIRANNIGQILKEHGDLAGALEYSRRALKIQEKVYGPDHPSVAIDANNIGLILQEQGDLAGALEYSRRALKIDEQVYGPDHPSVGRDANNIGLILKAQGDLAGALECSRRALQIAEKVYGSDHPTTKRISANLHALQQLMDES
ncbi:MAG TPA: tetratricopeptide repeat protein, partial [Candidatus Angelobacter sp.]|nr:tetratricopeptide repeat protein [Candidatus Angelobacter sp.]